jgi:hypothetical protein
MHYIKIGFGCLIASAISVVACGDDSTGVGGSGGSSTGGSATGGLAGKGGSAGSGFTGGSGGAGTTGGTGTTGGSAGSATGGSAGSGTSGTGGMSTGCPGTAPADGAMCNSDDAPDDCNYGTSVCECGGPPMGPEGTWSCSVCPTTAPTNGMTCSEDDNGSPCTYPGTVCECNGMGGGMGGAGAEGDTWECTVCPATEPADGSDCDSDMNDECEYGMVTCDCGGDDTWDCEM